MVSLGPFFQSMSEFNVEMSLWLLTVTPPLDTIEDYKIELIKSYSPLPPTWVQKKIVNLPLLYNIYFVKKLP